MFNPARIQNRSAEIGIRYFKRHSIKNNGSTYKVSELLAKLIDNVQIQVFYRGTPRLDFSIGEQLHSCTVCPKRQELSYVIIGQVHMDRHGSSYTKCEPSYLSRKCLAQRLQ